MNRDELMRVVAAVRNDVLEQVAPEEDLSLCSSRERESRKVDRMKRVAKANSLIDQFILRQLGDKPFETPEEAIQALAPIAVWFFGALARRFAIMVLRAVWEAWFSHTGK